MDNKKVLLIINSVAGKLASHAALYDIVNTYCKKDWDVTVKITQHRGHAKELAAEAQKKEYDLIICCGGDGTMNEVLNGLLAENDCCSIPVGYIPAGSTNDFAETLGISSDLSKSSFGITKENTTLLDVGKFCENTYFSYIASFGAFTAVSYDAPQDLKNTLGHFAYILQGVKDLSNLKPTKASVIADGVEYSGDFLFGSVSNTKSVAGIVKLKDNIVDLQDGLFEVLLVRNPKDIVELNEILIGATSSNFSSDMFVFLKAKEVSFHFSKSINWSLDGEKVKAGKDVTIVNLHEAVKLWK